MIAAVKSGHPCSRAYITGRAGGREMLPCCRRATQEVSGVCTTGMKYRMCILSLMLMYF